MRKRSVTVVRKTLMTGRKKLKTKKLEKRMKVKR